MAEIYSRRVRRARPARSATSPHQRRQRQGQWRGVSLVLAMSTAVMLGAPTACAATEPKTDTDLAITPTSTPSATSGAERAITPLNPDELAAAANHVQTIRSTLMESGGDLGPDAVAVTGTLTRLWTNEPIPVDLDAYFAASEALFVEREANGASQEDLSKDRFQFSGIALGIDPTYRPAWAEDLAGLSPEDEVRFWKQFGDLNIATMPALACHIRTPGPAVEEAIIDLGTNAGLFGLTHMGLYRSIASRQGCNTANDALDEKALELIEGARDPLLQWLSTSSEPTTEPPDAFSELSAVDGLDAMSEMEIGAIATGVADTPDERVVRLLLHHFEPDGALREQVDAAEAGDPFEWHALLNAMLVLNLVADPSAIEMVQPGA